MKESFQFSTDDLSLFIKNDASSNALTVLIETDSQFPDDFRGTIDKDDFAKLIECYMTLKYPHDYVPSYTAVRNVTYRLANSAIDLAQDMDLSFTRKDWM